MTVDNEATNHVYEAAQDLETFDDSGFLRVIKSFHEYERTADSDFPQYRVHLVIEDTGSTTGYRTYCYPIAEYAREEWGLYLFDTVADWEDETITMRFAYDPDN